MILFMMIAALAGEAQHAVDVPTYDEQVQQCESKLQRSPFPIGTVGYASIYDSCSTLERVALQRETGSLISQGRCSDAVNLALRGGDLQLAANIRAYCGASQR